MTPAELREYKRQWSARDRAARSIAAGREPGVTGRPPTGRLCPEVVRERGRLACRKFRESPRRVAEAWYREQFRQSQAELLVLSAFDAYEAWFESLDEDDPRAMDGALPGGMDAA